MDLILIAGLPASGKSRFAAWLGERLGLPVLSKDEFKEDLFDTVGFQSYEEKRRLDAAATKVMVRCAGAILGRGGSVILDNNFEASSKAQVAGLEKAYGCRVLTVLFSGDVGVVFERYRLREKDPDRHPGHVARNRYPGPDGEPGEGLTLREFEEKFRARGVTDFSLGETLRVDATDLGRVDYPALLRWVTDRRAGR